MATPHNSANIEDIAKSVLMPGDPLRAKVVAEKYLENVVCFNKIRNMFGYTGTYKGKRVSVMGSGMGMPSIGIYSYELFNFYDVDNIIRIGSIGAYGENVRLGDIIMAMGASTDSNFASQYSLPGTIAPIADFRLLKAAAEAAEQRKVRYQVGNVLSSDVYYSDDTEVNAKWKKMGVLGVEMESAALYLNAARAGKSALGIFSVSNHIFTQEEMSAEDRTNSFTNMMEVALDII